MRKPVQFFKEAYAELRKVVWPTPRRTARLTVIVVVITVLFSAFLAAIDFGLGRGIEYVIDNTQKSQPPAEDTQAPPIAPQGGQPPGQQPVQPLPPAQ